MNRIESSEDIYREIFSDRDLYPFDNYPERVAYIRSTTGRVGTLAEECRKPLITLIVGGANVGKSRLFNLLIGKNISPVKEISGYTCDFFIAADEGVDLNALEKISPDPARIYRTSHKWMQGKILVDTPDFDSINDRNRKRLEELIPLAHMVVVLVTAAKREIASLAEILHRYTGRKTFLFVMNKQDREEDYRLQFTTFLRNCGFDDPQIISASCAVPPLDNQNKVQTPAGDEQWRLGVDRIREKIDRVNEKQAKTRKFKGDVRDGIELLYNPTQVRDTLKILEEKERDYEVEVRNVFQAEVSSALASVVQHPRIVRDVVLVEVANRRWLLLGLFLRIWARYRFFLTLTGAGSIFSRASGSVIPFFSGVVSGLLSQAGQVTSLGSLRNQLCKGLNGSDTVAFFRTRNQAMKELLTRCRIRNNLHPSDNPSLQTEEHKQYLVQALEEFLSALIRKSYSRVLVFLELFCWTATAAYGTFRAATLYQHNQMALESVIFAVGACFMVLASVSVSVFVFYVGASIRRKLKSTSKVEAVNIPDIPDLWQPLQPAIEALKHFERSVEDALHSITTGQ